MGLDSVELLITVEKAFDIEIPDREAEKIRTVGDFYNTVWSKLNTRTSNKCNTAILFYKFRALFAKRYGIARNDFTPETLMEDLIPRIQRRADWNEIENEIQFDLPSLELPNKLAHTLLYIELVTIVGGLICGLVAVFNYHASYTWLLIPVCGVLLTLLLNEIFKPFKIEIAQRKVRDFIDTVLALNYKQISNGMVSSRQEVEKVIAMIIHEKMGVKLSDIRPEARITSDLGIE